MKTIYVKTILNIYPHIDRIIEQIDEIIYKKALASFEDYSPCLEQCVSIVKNNFQREDLLFLKEKIELALSKIPVNIKDLLEYKYFRKREKSEYRNIDTSKRIYFRHQDKAVVCFGNALSFLGIDEKFFEERFLCMDLFVKMVRIVKEQELCKKENAFYRSTKNKQIKLLNNSRQIDKNWA